MKKLISFSKRIIAVLLVLILAAVSNMVAFAAVDDPQGDTRSICGESLNPIYTDFTEPNENTASINGSYSVGVRYSTANDDAQIRHLAEVVRDSMIARVSPISITIKTGRTDLNAIIPEIFNLALSEEFASNSSAGDYLAWNYSGYKYSGTSLVTDSGYEYNINLFIDYYTTAQQEAEVTKRVNDALKAMNVNNMSEYDKIKNIYNYVCRVCNYDYSSNNSLKFSAYGAIVNGNAVCQGYCTLLYKMLKEVGIDNRIITSQTHSWNIVRFGNCYYNVDATWDDSNYDSGIEYSYFMRCSNHFANHNCESKYKANDFTSRYPIANECYANCGDKSKNDPPVTNVSVGTPAPQPVKTTTQTQTATVKQTVVKNSTPKKVTVGKTKIKSVAKKSKGFTVKWNKVSNADGYEIQYSTSNKFTKSTTKKVAVNKKATTSKAISKLKGNKKYYIRIRAYKNHNGTKCYSSWSTVKNVKTKK